MAGYLVQLGAMATCPHGGCISAITSNARVFTSGVAVVTVADRFMVAGCTFTVPPPQPCAQVIWMTGATRVLVNGVPPLTQTSTGLAFSATGTPGGPPMVLSTQPRVLAL